MHLTRKKDDEDRKANIEIRSIVRTWGKKKGTFPYIIALTSCDQRIITFPIVQRDFSRSRHYP